MGEIRVVPDFVPPPPQLAFRDEGVKATSALREKAPNSSRPKHRGTTRNTSAWFAACSRSMSRGSFRIFSHVRRGPRAGGRFV